ncbi:hypothetical protein GCM10007968_05650 [Sporolactobacillus putidus]|uniref:Uncharacterized protein n=1 Tax=Sporolactobacillus putidus TaxID=492735 RepID=A0A917VZX9_9BACL|nr:hypothetical protein GCM10007968_05650 [Sporolactobacillus putidus]
MDFQSYCFNIQSKNKKDNKYKDYGDINQFKRIRGMPNSINKDKKSSNIKNTQYMFCDKSKRPKCKVLFKKMKKQDETKTH